MGERAYRITSFVGGWVVVVCLMTGALGAATGSSGSPTVVPGHAAVVPNAVLTVANVSQAEALPAAFWGVDVTASFPFSTSNASLLDATPVSYVRFPGGLLGEEYNYTSGVITNPDGSTFKAETTTQEFVTSCKAIHCHAILQLPAEINSTATAAYDAAYIVNTLHFQPAYWEIGNTVPGWTHFGTPWANWSTAPTSRVTPPEFAQEVAQYITAVDAVDSGAQFLALGSAMGVPGYDQPWVANLTAVDGHTLAGISVHNYAMGPSPPVASVGALLSNLTGPYSLPSQVDADRGYIEAACSSCSLNVFVTEANAAESNSFTPYDGTFAGMLYVAADTAQALDLRLAGLDWFCLTCNFAGSWVNITTQKFSPEYTLFSKMLPLLGPETLATNVTGDPTFFAGGTYGSAGETLLLVNANLTRNAVFSVKGTGLSSGEAALRVRWSNGSAGPSTNSITLGNEVTVPPLTVEILRVSPPGHSGAPAQFHVGGVPTPSSRAVSTPARVLTGASEGPPAIRSAVNALGRAY